MSVGWFRGFKISTDQKVRFADKFHNKAITLTLIYIVIVYKSCSKAVVSFMVYTTKENNSAMRPYSRIQMNGNAVECQ